MAKTKIVLSTTLGPPKENTKIKTQYVRFGVMKVHNHMTWVVQEYSRQETEEQ